MSFDARDTTISKLLNKTIFDIPRNQRRYVWNQHNWKELIDDLIFTTESSANSSHFIGSIVLMDKGEENSLSKYIIIDGQQRIITITLLLISILIKFKENEMDDDYEGTIDFILAKDTKNNSKSILYSEYHASISEIVESVSQFKKGDNYNNFINKKIISKHDDVICEAIIFFYDYLSKIIKETNSREILTNIRDSIMNISLVKIVATSEEDSYTIFEILNARGQALKNHELLKNYIMRYIEPYRDRDNAKIKWEEMENLLSQYMERFIFHYCRHKVDEKKDNKVTDYQLIKKVTKYEDKRLILDDILKKAKYYEAIVKPNISDEYKNCFDYEYEIFKFFKSKRQEQFRPLLLSLINLREEKKISQEEYKSTVIFLYNFFICYTIIGEEKSNKLQYVVYKYAYALENEYEKGKINELIDDIKKKLPSYEIFERAFLNIGWSNINKYFNEQTKKNRAKIVIEIIEKYISGKNEVDDFTIEHIVADSNSKESAFIGNLLPLEKSINEKCKDKNWTEKLDLYSKSKYCTTRNFAQRYRNKEFSITNRSQHLAGIIYEKILDM